MLSITINCFKASFPVVIYLLKKCDVAAFSSKKCGLLSCLNDIKCELLIIFEKYREQVKCQKSILFRRIFLKLFE